MEPTIVNFFGADFGAGDDRIGGVMAEQSGIRTPPLPTLPCFHSR